MIKRLNCTLFFALLVVLAFSVNGLAGDVPLSAGTDGKVTINPVLNLKPKTSAPANPSEGDIFYANSKLFLFSNGKWVTLFAKPNYTYKWAAGAWGSCSSECKYTSGHQTRSVMCQRSDGVLVVESYCPASTRPSKSQSCEGTQRCD